MLNLTLLSFCIFILTVISATRIPTDTGLRKELTDTIKEIQQYGEPKEFDASLKELLAQLEKFQMVSPHAVSLDWDASETSSSSSSKTVCIVVSSFEGMYINSGIGTAYYALADFLISQGHSVTVIYTRDEPTVGGSWDEWVAYHKNKGINLISLPSSKIPLYMTPLQATSLRVYRYLLSVPSFDIVHFADFEGHGFYSTLAKKVTTQFTTTSFVVGLHGPTRWVLESNTARIPTSEYEIDLDWMERMSIENADAVWTPSAYMASWMSVQGWTLPSSIHLLPLAPGPEFREIAFTQVSVHAKEFVYFGRLEVRKGLVLFCDALDLFAKIYHTLDKQISVTFLGRSGLINGIEGTDYVSQRAGKWPFSIKMISDYSRKASLEYLMEASTARVAIVPSLSDNAPYTVFECLYAGIPFLASSVPSISPLFADDTERSAHLFEVKPHHIVSKMAGAVRNGISSVTPSFTVAQAESVWSSFYANVQPKAPVAITSDIPLVTVVIVHYNRPELVKQAIASVEAQTYENVEVILVDDGSNQQAARDYLDSIEPYFVEKNWKIIRGHNRYLGAARNSGAKAAQGQYILFLDDDNVFSPSAIEKYVIAAKLSGAEVLTAGHAVFTGTAAPFASNIVRHWMPLGASLTAGLFKNTFGDANFFVSKSRFELVGGFTEDKGVGLEEHEFFAKSIFNGTKLEVVPEILLFYRQHSEHEQMLYTTDMRSGEARRLRPYVSALGELAQKNPDSEQTHQSSRRSLVNLVARNAASPRSAFCTVNLTSIAPTHGPFVGGNLVNITGEGFIGCASITAVKIGTNDCTGVTIVNTNLITCYAPRGNDTFIAYDVIVTAGGNDVTKAAAYTYDPTVAPEGVSAIVDSTSKITVTLTVETDEGGRLRDAALCARTFDAATLALLGGSSCAWQDPSHITIQLTDDATIEIGDNITIPEGRLRGVGPNGVPNLRISLILQGDTSISIVNPVPFISTRNVAKCEGITLDGSSSFGSGGRRFHTVNWTLVEAVGATSSSIASIISTLASASTNKSLSVVLSPEQVTAGASFKFNLTLTNWFGKTASSQAFVQKSKADAPVVSIEGSAQLSIHSEDTVQLKGVYSGLACQNASGLFSATFKWTVTPTPSASLTINTQVLNIPAGLTAGTTYVVNFTVTDVSTGLTNMASVSIIVVPKDLVAILEGGGSIQLNKTLTLDASKSKDPENGPITFTWSCLSASGVDCSDVFSTDSVQSINTFALGAGTFTITVTVHGTFSRTATASVSLTVTQLPVLQIHINQLQTAYYVGAAIQLVGVIDATNVAISEITWLWSIKTGSLAAGVTVPFPSGINKATLDIAPNALIAGTTYTFSLTASHPAGVSGVATATLNILSNIIDNTTVCAVPNAGGLYTTQFQFSFGDTWKYTAGVNKFQIFYAFVGGAVVYPAAAVSSSYAFSIPLPVGSLRITGVATSSTKRTTRFTCKCTVAPGDLATIAANAKVAVDTYNLARIAFSLYNSMPIGAATSPTAFLNGRVNVLSRSLYFALNTLIDPIDTDSALLLSNVVLKVTDTSLNQLNFVEISSSGTLVLTLFTAVNDAPEGIYSSEVQQLTDLNTLQNAQDNIDAQNGRYGLGAVRRSVMDDEDDLSTSLISANAALSNVTSNPWADVKSSADAAAASQKVAAMIRTAMVRKLPLGVIINLFTDRSVKTMYKDSPSLIDGNGVMMGYDTTIITSSGIVPTAQLGEQSIVLVYLESQDASHTIPAGYNLSSGQYEFAAVTYDLNVFNLTQQDVSVIIPDTVRTLPNGTNVCSMYENGNWTSLNVRTDRTADNQSTMCTFPKMSTFALLNTQAPVSTSGPNIIADPGANHPEKKGLAGGVIAGIVLGCIALVAIVAVGSAIGVKKHRDNAAIATGRPSPRYGDSGAGGVAIDPPLDPIFVPAHMGPMYVAPANGSAGPTYLNRSAVVNQPQMSPVVYGTFLQQPPPYSEQPASPMIVAPVQAQAPPVGVGAAPRRDLLGRGDFSDSSDSDGSRSRSGSVSSDSSATSKSSRYNSRHSSDDDTMSSEIQEIAGEISRNVPRGHEERDQLSDRMDM